MHNRDIIEGLNEQQRLAVTCPGGPTLVLAGPGSGKTRVLTQRIAHVLRCGADPRSILAVTFTNKAANEMRHRLDAMPDLGPDVGAVTIGTFHSICVRILRREAHSFGISHDFVIYDQADQTALVKDILKRMNVDDKRYRPAAVLAAISRAKCDMQTPGTYTPPTYWHEIVSRVYEAYQEALRANNALDFDDLLMVTVTGLQADEEALRRYRDRFRHLLVDEFQDTNLPQWELVRLLAAPDGDVFVVGDEDQSIYGWRGADYRNLERFRNTFPALRTFLLEHNYRSTQTILDAAKAVIAHNIKRVHKDLQTARGAGEPICLLEAQSTEDEARYVASEVERLMSLGHHRLSDFAVMYRVNAQSRALEEAFMRRGLAYRLIGGTRFYHRREIKEVLAYLRLVSTLNDWVAFERVVNVPPRGLGDKSLAELRDLGRRLGLGPYDTLRHIREGGGSGGLQKRAVAALLSFLDAWDTLVALSEHATVAEVMDGVLTMFGYAQYLIDSGPEGQERRENVAELRRVAAEHLSTPGRQALSAFLDEVALVADVDELENPSEAAVMMTLHTAKGLEFPVVFMVGMQEGLLPHSRSIDDPDQVEEERRLCYVGMTRAMSRLYLLHSATGGPYSQDGRNTQSRFIDDLPPEVLQGPAPRPRGADRQAGASRPAGAGSRRPSQPVPPAPKPEVPRYAPGETVSHPQFGRGVVREWTEIRDDAVVAVEFAGKGVKRLLASLAPLERV